jgi:hypothetical protein
MADSKRPTRHILRGGLAATLLTFALGACTVLPPGLFANSPTAPPTPSAVCVSADDLSTSADVLSGLELSEDGLLTIGAQIEVVLADAKELATIVGSELQPLVSDLVVSLEGILGTVEAVQADGTVGSKLEAIGVSLVEIGGAVDALEVRFMDRCQRA